VNVPAEPAEPQHGAVATVDVSILKGFVGDNPEVVRDFLADYSATAHGLALDLRAAEGSDDMRRMAGAAHKLKSSSRAVGAVQLGDVCSALENACRSGSRDTVVRDMVQFEAALVAAQAEIDRLLETA